jgi:hypothetical protein
MENNRPLHKRKVGAAHFSEEASYDRKDYTTVGRIMQGYAITTNVLYDVWSLAPSGQGLHGLRRLLRQILSSRILESSWTGLGFWVETGRLRIDNY